MERPDLPLLSLLLANAVTIALALVQDWALGTVLAVYWFQSVTIGLFAFVRLLGVPAGPDGQGRLAGIALAGFFAVHYGLFHLVYLVFLAAFALDGTYGAVDPLGIAAGCAVFFVNHLVSFLWYRPREEATASAIFSEPYTRIVPMHLTDHRRGVRHGRTAGRGRDPSRAPPLPAPEGRRRRRGAPEEARAGGPGRRPRGDGGVTAAPPGFSTRSRGSAGAPATPAGIDAGHFSPVRRTPWRGRGPGSRTPRTGSPRTPG